MIADPDRLGRRVVLLDEISQLGAEGRLPVALHERTSAVAAQVRGRLGHGTTHTVVALGGGTGSGKSSLCNALVGSAVATSGVRRPTTAVAQSIVFGEPADALVDWLQIDRRHHIDDQSLSGLVLLDLPDHDSTAAAHRAEVDRLVEVVDVFVWVVDPQKYADAALHHDYLARFVGHGAVTLLVLNQIDRLAPPDRQRCIDDLGKLVAKTGLGLVRILATSASTGEGVAELRRELGARVAERRAAVARLEADLDWIGADLIAAVGDATIPRVSTGSKARLVDAATIAAGGNEVAAGVEAALRHRAALAVGSPLVRWVRHLRPDPLKRLGLGTAEMDRNRTAAFGTTIRRTAVRANPAGLAMLSSTVRSVAAELAETAAPGARYRLDLVAASSLVGLPDALDQAIGATELPLRPPRWWRLGGLLQTALAALMFGGLTWLALIVALNWLKVPELPLAKFHGWPMPTLMAIGGGVAGMLVALAGRRVAALGARRRGASARRELSRHIGGVINTHVVAPLDAEATDLNQLADRVRALVR